MKSNLKIVLGLLLVVVAVFGITIISQYTTRAPVEDPTNNEQQMPSKELLKYSFRHMHFDPTSEEPELRAFRGFYEPGDTLHWATYFMMNVNDVPVEVTASGRSCSSCTNARMAIVPQKSMDEFRTLTQAATIVNLTGAPDLISAMAMTKLTLDLEPHWKQFEFENPESMVVVPAGSPNKPSYAVMQVGFKVSVVGPKSISATLGLRSPEMPVPLKTDLQVSWVGATPFEVHPKVVELGDVLVNSEPKSSEIYFWSATRTQAELPPPIAVGADPFLRLGTPVPMTQGEFDQFMVKSSQPGAYLRITAGYRVPITLYRADPDTKPGEPARPLDIGPVERLLSFTMSGGNSMESKAVQVKANVQGIVSLFGGGNLNLGTYNRRNGVTKSADLTSEMTNLELEFVKEETSPSYLKVKLGEPRNEGKQRFWPLEIKINPNEGLNELPKSSVLAFRVKGTKQMIRIPITGRGF